MRQIREQISEIRVPKVFFFLIKVYLLSALCSLISALVWAQGMLPPKSEAQQEKPAVRAYLMPGETVQKTLAVTDAAGKSRPLLSYKAANDALVVGFFSARCPDNQARWAEIKRFYERFKGWHTAFLAVSVSSDETLEELTGATSKAGLPYPVARDEHQQVAQALHVLSVPMLVILDEWGQLRYRGPVKEAGNALEAVLGQEAVQNTEPAESKGCSLP